MAAVEFQVVDVDAKEQPGLSAAGRKLTASTCASETDSPSPTAAQPAEIEFKLQPSALLRRRSGSFEKAPKVTTAPDESCAWKGDPQEGAPISEHAVMKLMGITTAPDESCAWIGDPQERNALSEHAAMKLMGM